MSKAFKCDRCKVCFDPYAVHHPNTFATIKEIISQTAEQLSYNEVDYRDNDINLCPDCTEIFFNFLSGMQMTPIEIVKVYQHHIVSPNKELERPKDEKTSESVPDTDTTGKSETSDNRKPHRANKTVKRPQCSKENSEH